MPKTYFDAHDLTDTLPPAGWYPAQIAAARFRESARGNRMIQVVHALAGVSVGYARLAEYFLLEGASPFGLALARRRLVDLYRAAGRDPQPGDSIAPADLVGAHLEIEVEHELWQGESRLRVVGHRRPLAGADLPF
jgi:hypothetical protein